MRHARLQMIAIMLLGLDLVAGRAGARDLPGKRPNCPTLESRLAALEVSGASANRILKFRRKVARNCVSLNELQVLGTHNSYHLQPQPALLAVLVGLDPAFNAWEYSHLPLYDQFETEAIRQVELDVFADPNGSLYERRGGLIAIGQDPHSNIPELFDPGFKVLHVQDLDFETTCYSFVACLQEIRRWSDRHRGHLPIMVLVEVKDDPIPDVFGYGFATPVLIGPAELDAIDAEIRSVFPPRRLLTPDDIRRGQATLEEAVLSLGWPRLGAIRGRVLFTLDNGGHYRDDYLAGHPSLAGRVMFTDSTPGNPEAAFVKVNDPLADLAVIPALVADGYVVRTRADGDTVEARSGDTGPRDAAIASGAQWVSTDYPVPYLPFGTGYSVAIPGGQPARCNPINAPAGCRDEGLETIPQ